MTPAQATPRRRRSPIGNPEPIREASRDGRAGAWLRQFGRDLSYGVRLLLKAPGFSAAAIAIVALGVGAVTAIFSVVYGVALEAAAVPRTGSPGQHLQHVREHRLRRACRSMRADHRDWLASNHVFEDIALYRTAGELQPHGRRRTRAAAGALASRRICCRSSASRRRWAAASPRTKTRAATTRSSCSATDSGAGALAPIRRSWASRSSLNGVPYTVVGVMGPDFSISRPASSEAWTTLTHQSGRADAAGSRQQQPGGCATEAWRDARAGANGDERHRRADREPPIRRACCPRCIVVPTHADLLDQRAKRSVR